MESFKAGRNVSSVLSTPLFLQLRKQAQLVQGHMGLLASLDLFQIAHIPGKPLSKVSLVFLICKMGC